MQPYLLGTRKAGFQASRRPGVGKGPGRGGRRLRGRLRHVEREACRASPTPAIRAPPADELTWPTRTSPTGEEGQGRRRSAYVRCSSRRANARWRDLPANRRFLSRGGRLRAPARFARCDARGVHRATARYCAKGVCAIETRRLAGLSRLSRYRALLRRRRFVWRALPRSTGRRYGGCSARFAVLGPYGVLYRGKARGSRHRRPCLG